MVCVQTFATNGTLWTGQSCSVNVNMWFANVHIWILRKGLHMQFVDCKWSGNDPQKGKQAGMLQHFLCLVFNVPVYLCTLVEKVLNEKF